MTTNKPEALELARRAMRRLSNAERDRILEQYLSDGIAIDKARIAGLEAALIGLRQQAAPTAQQGELVAWVTADTVDGQTIDGKPRRVWWENKEGVGMPIFTKPQPAEQQPITCVGCEGSPAPENSPCSVCGQKSTPDVKVLAEALESLIKGYVGLLEAGKDRITSLGGDCDPVPVMEKNDPWLRDARAALSAYHKQGVEP